MVRKSFLKHSLSQEDFEKCLDGSGLALWRWDVSRDIVTLSASAQKILGSVTKERNMITSAELIKIVHPDDKEMALNNVREHFKGLSNFESSFRIYIDDGSMLYLRMVGDSLRTSDGRVLCVSGYIQNITKELKKEDQDHYNMHILDDILKYSPAATAILDKDLCYVTCSEKWLTQFNLGNLENKDIKGQSHLELCPEIERYNKRMLSIYNMVMRSGNRYHTERDFFYKNRDEVLWVSLDIHPWYDKSGHIAGIVIYQNVADDTPEAEMENQQAV